jgi:hypothetical protein
MHVTTVWCGRRFGVETTRVRGSVQVIEALGARGVIFLPRLNLGQDQIRLIDLSGHRGRCEGCLKVTLYVFSSGRLRNAQERIRVQELLDGTLLKFLVSTKEFV